MSCTETRSADRRLWPAEGEHTGCPFAPGPVDRSTAGDHMAALIAVGVIALGAFLVSLLPI